MIIFLYKGWIELVIHLTKKGKKKFEKKEKCTNNIKLMIKMYFLDFIKWIYFKKI